MVVVIAVGDLAAIGEVAVAREEAAGAEAFTGDTFAADEAAIVAAAAGGDVVEDVLFTAIAGVAVAVAQA